MSSTGSGVRMSFENSCPNCGWREVTDFAYGGEVLETPAEKPTPSGVNRHLYMRRNAAGMQREWWYHTAGCREWFIAHRDTTTNAVICSEPVGRRSGAG